jgi:hypothetical protein
MGLGECDVVCGKEILNVEERGRFFPIMKKEYMPASAQSRKTS